VLDHDDAPLWNTSDAENCLARTASAAGRKLWDARSKYTPLKTSKRMVRDAARRPTVEKPCEKFNRFLIDSFELKIKRASPCRETR
jgi:hypothetical protein